MAWPQHQALTNVSRRRNDARASSRRPTFAPSVVHPWPTSYSKTLEVDHSADLESWRLLLVTNQGFDRDLGSTASVDGLVDANQINEKYLALLEDSKRHVAQLSRILDRSNPHAIIFDGLVDPDPRVLARLGWENEPGFTTTVTNYTHAEGPFAPAIPVWSRNDVLNSHLLTAWCRAVAETGWKGRCFRAFGIDFQSLEHSDSFFKNIRKFSVQLTDLTLDFTRWNYVPLAQATWQSLSEVLTSAKGLTGLELCINDSNPGFLLDDLLTTKGRQEFHYPHLRSLRLEKVTTSTSFLKAFLLRHGNTLESLTLVDIRLIGEGSWVEVIHFLHARMKKIASMSFAGCLAVVGEDKGWHIPYAEQPSSGCTVDSKTSQMMDRIEDWICHRYEPCPLPKDPSLWVTIRDPSFSWKTLN